MALAALHARLHPDIDHDQRSRGSIITVGLADKTAVRGNLSLAGSHIEQRTLVGPRY